ncbi:SP_1767 family glycosyltransferase [Flavobacterium sp. MAHUQ-51]|uniref:SP_1767 family glycosyltransferase n=1 Tax=Flavobacterium sp. GCM10022190 TaxID=3252639 RepID=UPI0036197C39
MSINETIDEIVTYKKSLSRFGDGEFRLVIKERDIVFQNLSDSIAVRLNEVLNSKLSNHLVAIPSSFVRVTEFKRDAKIHWLNFINLYGNKIAKCIVDKNHVFGNAFISRFYIDYLSKKDSAKVVNELKKIWSNQHILIVEGEYSRLGVGNDLFNNALSIERIICPSKDAYSKYEEIVELSQKYGKDKLILIALGPTATILAYDLAKLNHWAIDIGHVDVEYMWMIQKAQNKIAIKGRYVAEASEGKDFELPQEEKQAYLDSIIYTIQ